MIQITDMDHLVLRVRDLEPMIDFYCRVIGCSVEWRRPDLGLVHLRAGSALIDLVTVDGPTGSRGGAGPGAEGHNLDHFCLRVKDFGLDAVVKHLEANGVAIKKIASRYGANGRGMSIYLNDSDGNGVELKGTDGIPDPQQQAAKAGSR
jgi:catechol 2,3-dioxygenase-like lactoylglutathione lyase family enzyme